MDWQLAITLLAIALASAYFVRSAYLTWQAAKAGSCAGACGCTKASERPKPLITAEQLTLRWKEKR